MNSPNNFPFTCDGESQVVDDLVSGGEPLDLVVFGWRNNPWFVKMTVGFDISWHRPHSPYSQDDLTDKAFNPDGKRKTKAFGVVEGEAIIGVYVYSWDGSILGMQLLTNKRVSELFGTAQGDLRFYQRKGTAGHVAAVAGMKYRVVKTIDNDSRLFQAHDLEISWTDTSIPFPGNLVIGEYHGNGGADSSALPESGSFNTLSAVSQPGVAKLTQIDLYHGDRGVYQMDPDVGYVVVGLECFYKDGTSSSGGLKRGKKETITLSDDYIKDIEVYTGYAIDSLKFFFNTSKPSERIGGDGGGRHLWEAGKVKATDSPVSRKMAVIGFTGHARKGSSYLTRLAPIWGMIPPESYVLKITSDPPEPGKTTNTPQNQEGMKVYESNPGDTETIVSKTWSSTTTSTTKYTFTDESQNAFEAGIEVEAHAGLKIEGVGELGGSVKTHVKDTITKTTKTENGVDNTKTETVETKIEFHLPPKCTYKAQGFLVESTCTDFPWKGVLTALYPDKQSVDIPVEGKWTSVSFSDIHVTVECWDKDGKAMTIKQPELSPVPKTT